MKKELINTFFLTFAAFLIVTTTNSVATNGPVQSFKLQQEVECKDYLGLEKLFKNATTAENQTIPLNVKIQCKDESNETYVRNDDYKFAHSSKR